MQYFAGLKKVPSRLEVVTDPHAQGPNTPQLLVSGAGYGEQLFEIVLLGIFCLMCQKTWT